MTVRRLAEIQSYHAHVYYDPLTSRAVAEQLRAQIAERFSVQLGRWHDAPVGPHARAMYQVAFLPAVFPALVPWLMLNRAGLAVLVHPNTANPRDDHLQHALWLGEVLDLRGEVLPEERLKDEVVAVNTEPGVEP